MRKDATEGNMEPMDISDAQKVYGAEVRYHESGIIYHRLVWFSIMS